MCVSYRVINSITLPFEHSIDRCDVAIENLGEESRILYFICLDKSQGYHHISVESSDREKLAFFGPDGFKYTFKIMPFGSMNAPGFYTAMIRQFQDEWTQFFRLLCNKQPVQYSFTTLGQPELITTYLTSTDNYLISCTDAFLPSLEVDKKFIITTPPSPLNSNNISIVPIDGGYTIVRQK